MKITREWAMPNRYTFDILPIRKFVVNYILTRDIWIDPYVGNSVFKLLCHKTNDLNPNIEANEHMPATDFLKTFEDKSVDGVLCDPPYSPRQISECYKGFGLCVTQQDTQSSFYSNAKDEIARIVKPNGYVITCGWNSNGVGVTRGFTKVELVIIAHGGSHNDTFVLVERKL